jgi:hypothetical protein
MRVVERPHPLATKLCIACLFYYFPFCTLHSSLKGLKGSRLAEATTRPSFIRSVPASIARWLSRGECHKRFPMLCVFTVRDYFRYAGATDYLAPAGRKACQISQFYENQFLADQRLSVARNIMDRLSHLMSLVSPSFFHATLSVPFSSLCAQYGAHIIPKTIQ